MSTNAASGPEQRRGRPRNTDVDDAVMRATITRLTEDGYTKMSLADIAADAGTTRPTLYRRWPDKRALVVAVLKHLQQYQMSQCPDIDVTSMRAYDAVTAMMDWLNVGAGGAVQPGFFHNLLAEGRHTSELLDLYREYFIEPRLHRLHEVLTALQQRGDILASVDIDDVVTALFGAAVSERIRTGTATSEGAQRIVKLLWTSIAERPGECLTASVDSAAAVTESD